jgi:hypothetical protein
MRPIYYNNLRSHELSGLGSVSGPRAAILFLAMLAPLGGCATVSVYEPSAEGEISLTKEQSVLHKASEAYCEDARSKGLATGETSFGNIARMLTGGANDKNAYWRKIGADKSAPASVVSRVRADMNESAKGLADLNALARGLLGKAKASKEDVNQFEKALIHARQARDSFSDALTEVNKRSSREYQISLELTPLDDALSSARATADELASTRADDPPST